MNPELLTKLSIPYPDDRPGQAAGRGLAEALGAAADHIWELHSEVHGDLDQQEGGIGWMAGHLDPQRSCLIGEHLLQCVWSMHTNLLEAALHVAEAEHWLERESESMKRAVFITRDGRPMIGTPRPLSPADELPLPMSDLHVGGAARAIGSALDCTGSAIVGVLGLPFGILTAGFATARSGLQETKAPSKPTSVLWRSSAAALEAAIEQAGPNGWIDWALGYRNMYVHRARRVLASSLKPRPTIFGPVGQRIFSSTMVRLLPQDPHWSEGQAWTDPARASCLTENANVTLSGLQASTATLLDQIAATLVAAWKQRRSEPALVLQPAAQWPRLEHASPSVFAGYRPGSESFDPALLAAGSDTIRRLRSAQVFDDQRDTRWPRP